MSAPAGSYSQMGPPNTMNQSHIPNPNVNHQNVPGGQFPTSGTYQNQNTTYDQVPSSEGRMMDPNGLSAGGQNYNPAEYGTSNPNSNWNGSVGQGQGCNTGSGGMANPNANPNPTTGQGYNQMPGHDQHYAAAGSAQTETGPESYGGTAGKGVHGVFKSIHGAGEAVRGNIMSAIDNALGNKEGAARNSQIAQAGLDEMRTGGAAARGPKQVNP